MVIPDTKERKNRLPPKGNLPIAADGLLHALPHPVLVLSDDDRIVYANFPAEAFFGMSETVLKRHNLDSLVTFASPLLALVKQVRQTKTTVNEYAVDLGLPDSASQRPVDLFATPLPEYENHILIMLQQRTMAQMIERQLTHRGAARSVSGMAAVLAHEIKIRFPVFAAPLSFWKQALHSKISRLPSLFAERQTGFAIWWTGWKFSEMNGR